MCSVLSPEQYRIQPIAEVSPPWWNLAHTSWFFVRNVLQPFQGQESPEDALFDYVLNSYYSSFGPRLERMRRGLMTRPTVKEVFEYRKSVDERVVHLIETINEEQLNPLNEMIKIGLEHEQQHQELFYTEIKYILYQNPIKLREVYLLQNADQKSNPYSQPENILINHHHLSKFTFIKGELSWFGNVEEKWGWDNEFPNHQYYLQDFKLQNRLVTNGEYLEFMEDKGYQRQILWLDNGWNLVQKYKWYSPLYWEQIDNEWQIWTLSGMKKLNLNEPVCHISYYEADAYANWKKSRLPTEREWEFVARNYYQRNSYLNTNHVKPNFIDLGYLHPRSIEYKNDRDNMNKKNKENIENDVFIQMLGDVWEWTSSYYEPYPGFKPFKGNLREYNQKFMDNQRVLRGGSCVSEPEHIRISYRNFWPPETRFQFSGIRLAQDI